MPSASVKSDSTGSSETQDPLGKLYLLVEKKIRNLEKRKNKLENYKAELREGKQLNEDQQRAVDAYDAVIASLELCREFGGQIDGVMSENVKIAKLQQKKQQEEKSQHELERLKQVLKVQDVLRRLKEPQVRSDFASGTNGAVELKAEKLKHLDALYDLITPPTGPEREKTSAGLKNQLNSAAENLLSLLDGKNKPAAPGTTYRDMKSLVYQIANCPYPKVPQSAQASNASSPVPEAESKPPPQPQKTKKSKANKGKNQIPNGETPVSEKTSSKQTQKTNSQVVATSPSSKSAPLPSTAGVATIVINSSSHPSQVSSPSKSVPQSTSTHSAPSGKSKKRETHSTEGPPPGITPPGITPPGMTPSGATPSGIIPPGITSSGITPPGITPSSITPPSIAPSGITPTVQGTQQNSANLIPAIPPQVRSGLGTVTNSALSHPNPYFNASQAHSASQTNSRVSLDINDLVASGNFNFLQESQVVGSDKSTSQAAVYVDPAVVSFGSMKPESLVKLHEQQKHLKQLTSQSVPPVLPSSAASAVDISSLQLQPQHSHIPSETFINQAYVTSSGPAAYSQDVPSYSSTAGVTTVEASASSLPAPIPFPKEEKKSYVEPSSSWATQEDTDGWGLPDPPPNSSVNGDNSWGVTEGNESSTWGDSSDVKPQGSGQDFEEKRGGGGGYRGMGRGRGVRGSGGGGYRGGRGNYNSYQGGGRGNTFGGGNGYPSRGSRGVPSNGGGYRGRGNFSRGGRGNEGNPRGMRRGGGGFQGNPQMQRTQY